MATQARQRIDIHPLEPRWQVNRRVLKEFLSVHTWITSTRIAIFLATIFAALWVLATERYTQAGTFVGQVLDFQETEIYHSPETPGYTSWVGLWQLPDGTIQSNFTQIAGGVSSAPVIQSTDGAETWSLVPDYVPRGNCRGMAVLDDGTMVRPVWGSADRTEPGYTQRSTNGGNTWSDPVYLPEPEGGYTGVFPSLIRQVTLGNGAPALVLMAGCIPSGYTPIHHNAYITKQMFISTDQGQSWGDAIELMPQSAGACEESDFVQLPSGDLMWIHRAEHFSAEGAYLFSNRMESFSIRTGDTFVSQPPTTLPWPHSGYPSELMTQEGIILDLCTTGSHWSSDNGLTWQDLMGV